MFNPESNPIQMGHEPVAANALADTSAWFDMAKAPFGLYIVIEHYRGGDTNLVLTVHEGTAASGTTAITTNAEFPIWVATDALTDPTLVRQTDALGYTINTATYTGSQIVVFLIKGANLSAGYRYVQLGASGGHASSIVSVLYIPASMRFAQDQAL